MPDVRFDRYSDAQMSAIEREFLYNIVVNNKPNVVCEVGTWKGGGSTYIISSGLNKNNSGKLYTVEYDADFYSQAIELYNDELYYLKDRITFNFGDSREIYAKLIESKEITHVDFLFLDGADDAQMTVDEYNIFESCFKTNTIIAIHDFKTNKAKLIKDTLIEANGWKKLFELDTLTGFAAFVKI